MNDSVDAKEGSSNCNGNVDGLSNELDNFSIDCSSNKKKKNTCLCCLKEVEGCSRCSKCRTALYCDRSVS